MARTMSETSYDASEAAGDKLRYQVALVFLNAVLIIAVANFIDDYANGRMDEVVVNALLFSFSIGALFYLTPQRLTPAFYIVTAAVLLLDVLYLISRGTGSGSVLMWLFFTPPIALYFLGLRTGLALLGAVYAAVLAISVTYWQQIPQSFSGEMIARFSMAFVLLSVVCAAVEYSRQRYLEQLKIRTDELEAEREQRILAERQLGILGEQLTMCSGCQKVQVQNDHWSSAEEILVGATHASVSHSSCPACISLWHAGKHDADLDKPVP